jgi:two-component sensor histidine kinase
MKEHESQSLKLYKRIILVFALSSVLAALLVGSALQYLLTRATLNNWRQQQEFITHEFATGINFEIEETLNDLKILATLPAFSNLLDVDQISPALKGIPENVEVAKRKILHKRLKLGKRFSTFFILRPNGDLYIVEPFKQQLKLKRQNFSARAYFKEAARTKKPVISDAFISSAGIPVVVMVVPVLGKAGNIISYLGGATFLTNLSRLVAKDQIGNFYSGFIVDRKGILIAHSDVKEVREQSPKDYRERPLVLKYLHQGVGHDLHPVIETVVNPKDGKVYFSSFVRLESGWGLELSIAKDTVLSNILPVVWKISVIVSLLVLAVSSVGVMFVKRVRKRWERAEKNVVQRTHDLDERVKELNCHYGISRLIETPGISMEKLLQGTVDLIPPAYQYPEITCGRIVLWDTEYHTKNFSETTWKQVRDIIVDGNPAGFVDVRYLQQKPEIDEGPFQHEERKMIDNIAKKLGQAIEHTRSEARVKASLKEKETLLMEIHHRVKNNMNVTSSLLKLQSAEVNDKKAITILEETRRRITAMALVHDKLYQSKDLANIDFGEYAKNLVENQLAAYGGNRERISVTVSAENLFFDIDLATPCGLIISELISNAMKHAFPRNRKGEINIAFNSINENEVELMVSDNGIGLPADLDFETTESFGLYLIKLLVEQIEGTVDLERDGGTAFRIRFGKEAIGDVLGEKNES